MSSVLYKDVKKIDDLPDVALDQIEQFFVAYNAEWGKKFEPKRRSGLKAADRRLEDGIKRLRRRKRRR